MVSSKKVCVVGAGVSGLVSARELLREGHDVTVMEQSCGVGGQWLYDPRTDGGDPLGMAGVHSGVYASLRLNVPRDSMGFSDFPFYPKNDGTGDARRYPGHAEFLRYLRDFCDAFGLMDVIRLNTKVLHVGLVPPRAADDGTKRWTVRCANANSMHGDCEGEVVTTWEVFDAVVVASGHHSQPRLPTINGMDKWRRRQLHSHSYRVPGSFRGEVVVVVGLGESGKEIALELRQVAREVHISVKSMDDATVVPGMRKALSKHHNLHLHLQVECLCEDGQVTFGDGSCVIADSIIYCTGYDYSFPFLDTGGLLTVDDNRVCPLYEHTFPPALAPSLSFVGVPSQVKAPRFYEVQGRGGWRRCCPAGGRCRRWRRCCGQPRSTTAPRKWPACPGASRMPSFWTWITATSSGRNAAASPGCQSGRRSSIGRPSRAGSTTRRASATTTATATLSWRACAQRAGIFSRTLDVKENGHGHDRDGLPLPEAQPPQP